jgi:hypothetical protein
LASKLEKSASKSQKKLRESKNAEFYTDFKTVEKISLPEKYYLQKK